MKKHPDYWAVPYLPIDPKDVGRSYDPIIRINSQSGKGGVAYVLEQFYGLILPRPVQQAFSLEVTRVSEERNSDLGPDEIYQLFIDTLCQQSFTFETSDLSRKHDQRAKFYNLGFDRISRRRVYRERFGKWSAGCFLPSHAEFPES